MLVKNPKGSKERYQLFNQKGANMLLKLIITFYSGNVAPLSVRPRKAKVS
jgi:hypothetical protein